MKLAKIELAIVILTAWLLVTPRWSYGEKAPAGNAAALSEALLGVKTPEAVIDLMREKFVFVEDHELFKLEDYWQSPEELWSRKAGDCEDFALFAQYALQKQGLTSQVISIYAPNGYAHTVAVFKMNGSYHVINEDRLYRYGASSLEKAVSRVHPFWTWASIAEKRGSKGWSAKKIINGSINTSPDFSF